MELQEKDTNIKIRIDRDTKEEFSRICKLKAINQSALIRQLIRQWIFEQEAPMEHRRITDVDNIKK